MVGEGPGAKPRGPMPPKKKRKDSTIVEKHGLSLAQQMEDRHEAAPPKRRAPKSRKGQQAEEYVTPVMSNKILAEARRQQLEVDNERDEETGVAATRRAFTAVTSEKRMDSDSDNEEDGGYSDTEEHHEEFDEVTEEDERIMSMFMASDATPQRTLADIIMERIHEAGVSGDATANVEGGGRSIPGIDKKVIEVYQGVGKLLGRYRSGKLPKAFKIIPSLSNWEEIMYLTDPEKWSPNAMYQATRVFASNFNARMAQRFYSLVLLPRIRQDIKEHKRLHFALYQSLKKAVYKPSAFYKGVLLPLCQCCTFEDCRDGVLWHKQLFFEALVGQKYALPYRVLDAVLLHFVRFTDDDRDLPVIWHQSLLTFVQRYKNELSEEDKEKLRHLMRQHKHYLVTPEIQRELLNSRNRGQKDDSNGLASMVQRVSKVPMQEDVWNMPEVVIGMDED